ncbi:transglycosylase family protein [Streptomyces sp. NPDC101227]|uniref:transglycosylase family protein n=1 Tax=Streptomyces sp. NPDC101227 TaxID=3366136 RepID=UPI003821D54D
MSSHVAKRSVEAILSVLIVLLSTPGLAGQAAAAAPPTAPEDTNWERIAHCESSGRWHINTGNGYHGGLQIDLTTWQEYGGRRYAPRADLASRSQQIAVGERIAEDRGLAPWPNCGHFGLFDSDGPVDGYEGAVTHHRHASANHHSRKTHQAHRTHRSPSAGQAPRHQRTHKASRTQAGSAYVVQRGDCLSVIADNQHIRGGTQALYDMNEHRLDEGPDHIYPGQQLRLHR